MPINLSLFNGKKILVTGYSGYLGSSLCSQFLNSKILELRLLSRKKNYKLPNPQSQNHVYISGDIKLKKTWKLALNNEVDYIFHLAASEINNLSNSQDFKSNFQSITSLLFECEKLKQKPKIIFASSANISGSLNSITINELTEDKVLSLWSLHKLMAEQYLNFYKENYSIPSVSLRFTNIFGPTENKEAFLRMVLNKIIHNAIFNIEINLYENKNFQRDFLYIDDAVSSLIYSALNFDKLQGEKYYYIGSGEGKSFLQLANLIDERFFNLFKKRCRIYHHKKPLKLIENRQFIIDSSRFKKITGWNLSNNFKYNLNKTFDLILKKM